MSAFMYFFAMLFSRGSRFTFSQRTHCDDINVNSSREAETANDSSVISAMLAVMYITQLQCGHSKETGILVSTVILKNFCLLNSVHDLFKVTANTSVQLLT